MSFEKENNVLLAKTQAHIGNPYPNSGDQGQWGVCTVTVLIEKCFLALFPAFSLPLNTSERCVSYGLIRLRLPENHDITSQLETQCRG